MERRVAGSGDQEIGNQVARGTFYEKKNLAQYVLTGVSD